MATPAWVVEAAVALLNEQAEQGPGRTEGATSRAADRELGA